MGFTKSSEVFHSSVGSGICPGRAFDLRSLLSGTMEVVETVVAADAVAVTMVETGSNNSASSSSSSVGSSRLW